MNNLDPAHVPTGQANSGSRRLSKFPMMLLGGAILLVLLGIVYALHKRGADNQTAEQEGAKGTVGNSQMAAKLLANVGDGIVDSKPADTIIIDNTKTTVIDNTKTLPPSMPIPESTPEDEEAKRIAAIVRQFREKNFYEAVVSRTTVEQPIKYDSNEATKPSSARANTRSQASQSVLEGSAHMVGAESLLEEKDPNLRVRKEVFAKDSSNPYGYSSNFRTPALTRYEVRVGTVIPAVMISGINSDLPGDIIAQVSHDVRDTQTGRHVLIPLGSKLIGKYDSHIAMGQERVMVAWYRLQFPDSSTLDLDNMRAVDLAGYAGMSDEVNHHTWRLFKNALLLSVISAGAQVAIGQDNGMSNSPVNTAASEMGRQFGQLGTEMIRRQMNVQPTLEIRPGYQFNVMVNKDLILKPY